MGNIIKNLATILGIATVAFAAYYLYAQRSTTALDYMTAEQSKQTMLANTSVFISHSQELDQISLDLSVLEDPRFRSLETVSPALKDKPVGRGNPFANTGGNSE